MSLSENELTYLMAYVDDQVDDDELPDVRALLARSEEARAIVAQHRAMGDWLRDACDGRAREAGADEIASNVLRQIDELGGGKVIELERERARLAKNRQRVKELSALFVVAAAAAAFFLLPTSSQAPMAVAPTPPSHVKAPAPPPQETASPTPSASAVAATDSDDPSVEVQSVESPSHPFSIFYVPGATGLNAHASSVVVWVQE
jgi:anti-sigma factor RsiW